MRASSYLLCLLALLPVAIFAAAADDLELVAVMVEPGKTSVQIKDKASGRTRWMVAGETVAGYTFKSYNASNGSVAMTKDNFTSNLTLKTAKILSTAVPNAPTAQPPAAGIPALPAATDPVAAQQRAILNNLRQIAAAADQYYLENGTNKVTLSDLVGPEPRKYIKQIVPVAGEDYSKLELAQGKELVVPLPDGTTMKYGN